MSVRMLAALIVLTLASVTTPAFGQLTSVPAPIPIPLPGQQQAIYSVKFLCGFQAENDPSVFPAPSEPPVKPGNYATAVNIINFHNFPVRICKAAVVANPERCSEPNTSAEDPACRAFFGARTGLILKPQQAFEVDCDDIVSLLGGPSSSLPPFIKGFVEVVVPPRVGLSSNNPLAVTGVYTAQQCRNAPGAGCKNTDTLAPGGVRVVPETSALTEPSFCD